MSRVLHLIFVAFLIGTSFIILPLAASALPANCVEGMQVSGAKYRICMPVMPWNGDLVLYAHGYVAPGEPLEIPEAQLFLPDGTSIPDIITGLGYAFATTSYRKNGLAVREGIKDIRDLVRIFRKTEREAPRHIYLAGASEGGLIAALAIEQFPQEFSGGLSLCGPIGSFQDQVNYWGDFRVIFDYFFPNVLPPSPVAIPDTVVQNWDTYYMPLIASSVAANPLLTGQLLQITQAPIDPGDPSTAVSTAVGVLWYNVFATNDAIEELNGKPFDNQGRIYVGSFNDYDLNLDAQRFGADTNASAQISAHYETTGRINSPLVTLHNTLDPVVPYWHELLYDEKVLASGSGDLYDHMAVERYGHCNFTAGEALAGFARLVIMATGQE